MISVKGAYHVLILQKMKPLMVQPSALLNFDILFDYT